MQCRTFLFFGLTFRARFGAESVDWRIQPGTSAAGPYSLPPATRRIRGLLGHRGWVEPSLPHPEDNSAKARRVSLALTKLGSICSAR